MKVGLKIMLSMILLCAGLVTAPGWAFGANTEETTTGVAVDLLKEMPADSQLIAFTQPLNSLDSKVNNLAKLMGIPLETFGMEQINFAGLLSSALAGEGLALEIDGTRGIGLAAPKIAQLDKMPLVFVPVKDAQANIESMNLTRHPEIEGVWYFADVSLMPVGDYLVATEDVSLLKHLKENPKGVKLSAGDQDLAERSDIAVFVKVGEEMPALRDQLLNEIASSGLVDQPALAKLATTAVNRLTEVEKAGLGISLLDEGISMKLGGEAKQGSVLAGYFSGHPMTDVSALESLPEGKMLEAYAIQMDPKLINGPLTAILDAAIEIPEVAELINPADIQELKDLLTKVVSVGHQQATAIGMYLPAETEGTGLQVIELCSQADVDEMFEVFSDMVPVINKIVNQVGISMPMSFERNVGEVGGLSYDEMVIDLSYLPLPPEIMQMYAGMFGGEAKITEQICKIDDDLFVVAFGEGTLDQAVALAQSKTTTLDQNAGIKQAAKYLPQKANGLFFLDVGNYLKWYVPMMQGTLMETMQAQGASEQEMMEINMVFGMLSGVLNEAKGTLGGSIVMDQGRLGMEFYLPHDAIQSIAGPLIAILPQIILK
ncbi:MAG: hypothetical protein GY869_30005 [Planctomycetes bacterium]|nr:hypothetical protein [Planctomycetota bacterium]